MAVEAIECYLESLQKDGLPLQVGDLPGAPLTEHVQARGGMSRRLPATTGQGVLRTLERTGFYTHHVKGSHHSLRHPELRVVPVHKRDLPPGTLRSSISRNYPGRRTGWRSVAVARAAIPVGDDDRE